MGRTRWIVPVCAATAFAVIGIAEILLDPAFRARPLAPAVGMLLVVGGTLLTVRLPVIGSIVAAAMFPATTALGLAGPTGLGVLAVFLLPGWSGFRRPPRRSWPAPLGAQFMATVGVLIAAGGQAYGTGDTLPAMIWENLFFSSLAWASWGVGLIARRSSARAEQLARLATALDAERENAERAAVAQERQRIAREIHDAVAHSVSVMTLQVGAVRSTLPTDAPQAEMLQGIERLGRESVAELRAVVGILRDLGEDNPVAPPSLARAEELIADVRAAGLPIDVRFEGERIPLTRSLDVSAYRVLQEALTNVLRHAGPVATLVTIGQTATVLTLEVANARAVSSTPPLSIDAPGGHGLIGMRERVAMFHGSFEAGPTDDGGFRVRAQFPQAAS